ncbi:hypothetical protein HRbin32_00611 [bacterium HR32]|jgi:DNA-directed RNA polymerase specialized sigma24 family protein|nr:hypothetical protein HRbin32_00611 [bacterium HR32]
MSGHPERARDAEAYALFHRALVHRDREAWSALYARYENLVAAWARRHPGFLRTGEPVDYFVNRAFEKLLAAVDGDKFSRFPDLPSVLRYLKMCTHSAVLDLVRARQRQAFEDPGDVPQTHDPEAEALERLHRQEVWDLVQSLLRDDRERVLVYESFVMGSTPQELRERRPDLFPTVQEVYLAKRNLLGRLRRHPKVRALCAEG